MIVPVSWWTVGTLALALALTARPAWAESDGTTEAEAAQEQAAPASAGAEQPAPSDQSAAPATPEEEASPTEEVHSQVASFAVTKLHDSPAVVTAVSAEEIKDSGARDLSDVLMLVPGFFLGVDVQGTVGPSFRGLWGQEGKVLLLIDGKEMNEQLYSTLQLGHEFPVELIERVEVVRGPGSVIYGGNAELAVINVITRGAQGSTDLLFTGTYGEYSSTYARRSATVSGRYVFEGVPGLSAFASASIGQGQRSDANYRDFSGETETMAGQSQLDPTVIQAGVGYRDLQLSFLYHRYYSTGIDGNAEITPVAVADFESFHAELTDTFRPNDRLEITPRLNFTMQSPYREADEESEFFYNKQVQRFRGRLVARWAALDFLQLTGGADLIYDRGQLLGPADVGLQTAFNGDEEEVSYQNYAGFIEAFSENPIVNVVAGARYDHHSAFGDSFVPRLVLLRAFGPVGAKALFSRAFRAPGIENISLGADVRPEQTTVLELEASLQLGAAGTLSVNVFDEGIQDPITYSYDVETNAEAYRNLGRVGSRGVEVDYRVKGKWGHAAASYSFYTPSGESNVEDYLVPGRTDAFIGIPTHKATLSGSVKVLPWLSISPTAVLVGQRFAVGAADEDTGESEVVGMPPQLLLNLYVRAENVGVKGLELGAGVFNLLGADFRVAQPYTGGHAPLPIFTREFLLRVTYFFEPGASE